MNTDQVPVSKFRAITAMTAFVAGLLVMWAMGRGDNTASTMAPAMGTMAPEGMMISPAGRMATWAGMPMPAQFVHGMHASPMAMGSLGMSPMITPHTGMTQMRPMAGMPMGMAAGDAPAMAVIMKDGAVMVVPVPEMNQENMARWMGVMNSAGMVPAHDPTAQAAPSEGPSSQEGPLMTMSESALSPFWAGGSASR